MKIVLIGYMGSGKSTIGKLLAEDLALSFLDLDAYIEKVEEKSITNIFKEKGEIYFRKKETESLRTVLEQEDDIILSIGGGTPCYSNNMKLISELTNYAVYLQVSVQELSNRLVSEKSERPLISVISDDELPEFIGKHLFERSYYYTQAQNTIACDNKSPKEIVGEIKEVLS